MDPRSCPVNINHSLKPGSAIEFVYRSTVELITNTPTPEVPMCGGGVTTVGYVLDIAPFVPQPEERSEERVVHYLARLKVKGLLDINEANWTITLPKGEME
jgi:hypothetical protein